METVFDSDTVRPLDSPSVWVAAGPGHEPLRPGGEAIRPALRGFRLGGAPLFAVQTASWGFQIEFTLSWSASNRVKGVVGRIRSYLGWLGTFIVVFRGFRLGGAPGSGGALLARSTRD